MNHVVGLLQNIKSKELTEKAVNNEDFWGYTPFASAAKSGHVAIMEKLAKLLDGAHEDKSRWLDLPGRLGMTPLIVASTSGHAEVVEYLLKEKANIHIQDFDDCTALARAAEADHNLVISRLIRESHNFEELLNVGDRWGRNPLSIAAHHGHGETVSMFLSRSRLDTRTHDLINKKDPSGRTPLDVAVHSGHAETVKSLLAERADVSSLHEWFGMHPLLVAAEKHFWDMVPIMYEYMADVAVAMTLNIDYTKLSAQDEAKFLIELRSVLASSAGVTEKPEEAISMVFKPTKDGKGVKLHCEIRKPNATWANRFTHRVPTSEVDNYMDSINAAEELMASIAKAANSMPAVVAVATVATGEETTVKIDGFEATGEKEITDCCAEPCSKHCTGNTVLMSAVKDGEVDAFEQLLKGGADSLTENCDKKGIAHVAAMAGHVAMLESMERSIPNLKKQANKYFDKRDTNGNTPICDAAGWGRQSVIERLVEYRSDVDIKNNKGETPLIHAAAEGRREIVEWLVAAGANLSVVVEQTNCTALTMAIVKDHPEVSLYLLQMSRTLNLDTTAILSEETYCNGTYVDVMFHLAKYSSLIPDQTGSKEFEDEFVKQIKRVNTSIQQGKMLSQWEDKDGYYNGETVLTYWSPPRGFLADLTKCNESAASTEANACENSDYLVERLADAMRNSTSPELFVIWDCRICGANIEWKRWTPYEREWSIRYTWDKKDQSWFCHQNGVRVFGTPIRASDIHDDHDVVNDANTASRTAWTAYGYIYLSILIS
eukprot:gnl/MRDRNA2_/MRDRNA2_58550_c0_seq3.p1 gnl/MRDRNA2_/MRDRNA2_58550_c0~~gnl/MRDRNA2_/MRDRNA2_58550_c0_seq3.p1  ORF type:complete len:783 (+),score=133.99 gnl/MRDRNA2_/MRDRNA2_58550_c0_seq3:31-2349(+)